MQITLPPEVEAILHRKIAAGDYNSPDEAIAFALQILDDYETWDDATTDRDELRKFIQEGLAGPSLPGEEVMAQLQAELQAKLTAAQG